MENHILELLRQQPLVMVPGLGAFVGATQESKYNNASRELMPPTRVISFSSLDRTYDLTLANYISKKLGLDIIQAGCMIEAFATEVKQKLQKTGNCKLSEIGLLYTDSNGEIRLTALKALTHSEVFGLPAIRVQPLALPSTLALETPFVPTAMVTDFPLPAGELATASTTQLRTLKPNPPLRKMAFAAIALACGCMIGFTIDRLNQNTQIGAQQYSASRVNVSPRADKLSYRPQTESGVDGTTAPATREPIITEEYVGTDSRTNPAITDVLTPTMAAPKVVEAAPVISKPDLGATAVFIIGSFGNKANAERAAARIRKMGHEVYRDNKAGLVRVGARVRYIDNQTLQTHVGQLKNEFDNAVKIK